MVRKQEGEGTGRRRVWSPWLVCRLGWSRAMGFVTVERSTYNKFGYAGAAAFLAGLSFPLLEIQLTFEKDCVDQTATDIRL